MAQKGKTRSGGQENKKNKLLIRLVKWKIMRQIILAVHNP